MGPSREGTADLWEAMSTMRAIRWFRPDPVPRALLWRVLEAATQAPSGTNTQPWRFLVIEDSVARGRIAAHLRAAAGRAEEIQAQIDAAAARSDRSHQRMYAGVQQLHQRLDSAPVFILACLVRAESTAPEEILMPGPVFQATQNLQLMARGLGLGTVVTSFQSRMAGELRQWHAIPDGVHPVALILLGYPDANFGPLKRKPVEEVTYWDTWGSTRGRGS